MDLLAGGTMSCGICGGAMVEIRGRYPKQENRKVCPTCLAERMDQIREVSSPDYGRCYEAGPKIELIRD
jgi:hypothetical protein